MTIGNDEVPTKQYTDPNEGHQIPVIGSHYAYDPRSTKVDYGNVQKYLKIEKLRRRLEAQNRARLIAERYISLHSFTPQAFQIIEPRRIFVPNWHIDAINDHLMAVIKGDIQHLIINMPPRHMKSLSVAVFFPAWTWTIMPETQFIYSSYSSGLSIRDSIKTRRLIQSDWYKTQWSEIVKIRDDQNQKTRFENTEGGYRVAASVLGAITGEGGNVIVVDDPHNMKEIFSKYKRTEAITWWDQVMSTRVNNPETDHKIIMSQRGHENDLVGHLIKSMERALERAQRHDAGDEEVMEEVDHYETLILPAEYRPRHISMGKKPRTKIGFSDPRVEEGELLYPERFPRGVINALKSSLGTYAASAQLQQDPVPAGGAIFSIASLRAWAPAHMIAQFGPAIVKDTAGQEFSLEVLALPSGDATTDGMSWDFSFADFDTSSFVCGQVWRTVGANHFLMHQSLAQRDFKGSLISMGTMVKRYPFAQTRLVEQKANGYAIISSLRDKISGIVPITPKESKIARAQAVSPIVEAGNLIIPHPLIATWIAAYVLSLISFPFGATTDEVDATTQWINYKAFGPNVTIS